MTLTKANKSDYKIVKKLYQTAFPPEERPPFFLLKRRAQQGRGELLVAREEGQFIGFVYLISNEKLIYLFFLAVDDHTRGSGYGSRILKMLQEQNPGRRIFLAREPLNPGAENNEQRIRRRHFYLRNGFIDWPVTIVEQGYRFDTMGIGEMVTPGEYDALIDCWLGRGLRRWIPMQMEMNAQEHANPGKGKQ